MPRAVVSGTEGSLRTIQVLADSASITPVYNLDGRPYLGTIAALSQASQIENAVLAPQNGQSIAFRVISSTARALTWGSKYKGSGALPLPTTTTGGAVRDYFLFVYASTTDTYDCVSSVLGVG